MKMAGYCKLCRAKELELYGNIYGEPCEEHKHAVKLANCTHPAEYEIDDPIPPGFEFTQITTGNIGRRKWEINEKNKFVGYMYYSIDHTLTCELDGGTEFTEQYAIDIFKDFKEKVKL